MARVAFYEKYGSLAFFLIIGLVTFLMLRPFITTILLALILVYAFLPVYTHVKRLVSYRGIASFLTVTIICLCFIIPAAFVVNSFIMEARSSYTTVTELTQAHNISTASINSFLQEHTHMDVQIQDFFRYTQGLIESRVASFAHEVPLRILNFFLLFFLMYYLFKEHKKVRRFIIKVLPFNKKQKTRLAQHFSDVIYGVLYGQMVAAILQGLLAGIGYWIFGFGVPIIWAIITMLFALVPVVGTAVVWVPASIYLFLIGLGNGMWWQGVGLFIYGMFIISTLDNFLRPVLMAGRSRMHPALIFLGAIGGIGVFGLVGLFIGPLLMAVSVELIEAFQENTI
ncbi:MAG: AI-2E family transporter [Nanoarchaeota archaeon]